MRCACLDCSSVRQKGREIAFHLFPCNSLGHVWAAKCGRPDILLKSLSTLYKYQLCSLHFTPDQYLGKRRKRLKPNAIPSVFKLDASILSGRNGIYERTSNETSTIFSDMKYEDENPFELIRNSGIKEEPEDTCDTVEESRSFELVDIKLETEIKGEDFEKEFYGPPGDILKEDEEGHGEEDDSVFPRRETNPLQWEKEDSREEDSSSPMTSDSHAFVCYYCGYKSKCKEDVVSHVEFHLVKFRYQCSKCNYKTNYLGNYKEHLSEHSGLWLYECPECDFKTNYVREMNMHPFTHSETKILSCSECDYKAICKRNLTAHLLRHLRRKKYQCNECSFHTNFKTGIEKHMAVHPNYKLEKFPAKEVIGCSSADQRKSQGMLKGKGRAKYYWTIEESVEILWCYRYATHRSFPKTGVSQRLRVMLLRRNNIKREKLDSISDLLLGDMALCIRLGRTQVSREQIKHVDEDVEEYMKREFSRTREEGGADGELLR